MALKKCQSKQISISGCFTSSKGQLATYSDSAKENGGRLVNDFVDEKLEVTKLKKRIWSATFVSAHNFHHCVTSDDVNEKVMMRDIAAS